MCDLLWMLGSGVSLVSSGLGLHGESHFLIFRASVARKWCARVSW